MRQLEWSPANTMLYESKKGSVIKFDNEWIAAPKNSKATIKKFKSPDDAKEYIEGLAS